jgi:hypothetical protein
MTVVMRVSVNRKVCLPVQIGLPGPRPNRSSEEPVVGGAFRLLQMPASMVTRGRRVDIWLTVSAWLWTAYFAAFALAVWAVL